MMRDLRTNPRLRDLAVIAERIGSRPWNGQQSNANLKADLKDLHDKGRALVGPHTKSTDLAELAANYQDSKKHRQELAHSAREVLRKPVRPMPDGVRTGVGCYLAALGTVVLAITPWAWSLATGSVGHTTAGRARFLGLSFRPTTEFNLIIIVMLMSVLGSIAVMIITFANRAGQETLDRGFVWWYLTRPFAATAIGVLFYMAIIAGFFNQASATGRSALVLAAAIGGLAGLFTDNVLQKMRSALLGLSAFDTAASGVKQAADKGGSGS
jgi:hypothetical protein